MALVRVIVHSRLSWIT